MPDPLTDTLRALAEHHGLSDAAVADLQAWALDLLQASTRDPDALLTELGVTRHAAASGPRPELPSATDRFEFRASLGAGGMGEVWRVWDRGLRRSMAMKTVRTDREGAGAALARFVVEAQVTSQLRHPAIVPVHELGRLPDGRLFFTMREVRGRTLRSVIRALHEASDTTWATTDAGWTLPWATQRLAEACDAVGHAHARGVVHRDLKPTNLMIGEFGEVQVIDWGVAKVLGAAEEEPVQTDPGGDPDATRVGEVIGTPAFMPPEQAYGWRDRVDARSDVYALGAVLYELLSGRPPYEPEGGRPVLSQVLEGPPRPVGRLDLASPPALVAVCEQAMARDRTARHADARALAAALRDALQA